MPRVIIKRIPVAKICISPIIPSYIPSPIVPAPIIPTPVIPTPTVVIRIVPGPPKKRSCLYIYNNLTVVILPPTCIRIFLSVLIVFIITSIILVYVCKNTRVVIILIGFTLEIIFIITISICIFCCTVFSRGIVFYTFGWTINPIFRHSNILIRST
jgi:hypothetical protein